VVVTDPQVNDSGTDRWGKWRRGVFYVCMAAAVIVTLILVIMAVTMSPTDQW
jgi:hypothetical protein